MGEIISVEQLENASIDAKDLGECVHGNETGIVTPRLGDPYPTLPNAVKLVIETGGYEPFATQALLLASAPTLEKKAAKALDTKKIWLWENGAWADTGLSELDLANRSAAAISAIGDYLTESSKIDVAALSETSNKYLVVKAIRKVAITNPVAGKQYRIGSVFKNAAGSGSRITINDDTGVIASIIIPVETVVSGVHEYTLTGNRAAKVLIDWDGLPNSIAESNLGLFFNNDKYYQEYANTTNTAQNTSSIESVKPALLPDWVIQTQANAIFSASDDVKKIVNAIKGISIVGAAQDQLLRLTTVAKQDATFGTRFLIVNEAGTQVLTYIVGPSTVKSGVETLALTAANSSGLSGTLTINWNELNNGLLLSLSTSPIIIRWNAQNLASAVTAIEPINQDITAVKSSINKLNPLQAPTWLKSDYLTNFLTLSDTIQNTARAIKGVEVLGAASGALLRFTTVCKNDASFATRFIITNSSGVIVARYDANNSIVKTGVETLTLNQVASSGISVNLTVDWDQVPQGAPISGNFSLYIDLLSRDFAKSKTQSEKNSTEITALQASVGLISGSTKVATKPYRVAIAGSSITWGQGYLGEGSYVGVVEQVLRNQYAKTIHASSIAPGATTLSGNDFYLGSAKRISGLNTEVTFSLDGDELSLSIARERENAGAALIELYVDNVLYDTFDTYTRPSVSRTENFVGNGSVIKFNLDGCFTYDHALTLDGVAKVGKLNTQSTGASIPSSDDYMVIRRYDSVSNRVVHGLWFKEAPTGAIAVTYKQGENIRHLRGTIDRSGAGLTTALESAYGDGSTSYDPANPSNISSGFGFRESDKRSVKTWKFSDSKTRTYKLKIKALHSSATGSTPYLDLNFATNRMHHIMNAGIGGWSAAELISNVIKLNTVDEVINFNPDILLIESCTNDDAITGVFKAHVVRTGLTVAQILASATANYFSAITGTVSNKTVNDVRLPMTAIDSTSITLASNVVDSTIVVGDAVVIGDYGCNHKRVAVRTVKSYDSVTKKITLNRSISVEDFSQISSLNELLTEFVLIYNAPTWVAQNKQLVDLISAALPECKINIATAGVPHFYLRKLFGYRELAQQTARDKNIGFVDYYNASFDFQYVQLVSNHQTINSTGASEYALTGTANTFPNPKVFVNGVEHKKFRITGGLTKHWAAGITDPTLSNTSNAVKAFRLIFDADAPVSGSTIIVQKSTVAWANDFCHPTGPQGFLVLGQAAAKILKDVN